MFFQQFKIGGSEPFLCLIAFLLTSFFSLAITLLVRLRRTSSFFQSSELDQQMTGNLRD